MGEEGQRSADQYIRSRMLAGARDAEALAKELTAVQFEGLTHRQHLEVLYPMVRAYTENRVRGWQRAIENATGRRKDAPPPNEDPRARSTAAGASKDHAEAKGRAAFPPRDFGPVFQSPLEAREAFLRETTYVPGHGDVWNRDLTREHLRLVIARLERVRAGVEQSIRFRQSMAAAMERHGAAVFGEVPMDVPLDGG